MNKSDKKKEKKKFKDLNFNITPHWYHKKNFNGRYQMTPRNIIFNDSSGIYSPFKDEG